MTNFIRIEFWISIKFIITISANTRYLKKKRDQNNRHVDACPRDLTVPLFLAEMRTDTQKKDSRANEINDRD